MKKSLGGLAGILLALWGLELISGLRPNDLPQLEHIGINGRVLAFALGISVLTGLLAGLAPALRASRPDLINCLKQGERGPGSASASSRLRDGLVVAEVALSLLLLI